MDSQGSNAVERCGDRELVVTRIFDAPRSTSMRRGARPISSSDGGYRSPAPAFRWSLATSTSAPAAHTDWDSAPAAPIS
jgi:hypothetical protein